MIRIRLLICLLPTLLAGCQSVYYDTMERFGVQKREILVDRVQEAQRSQEAAKEQFQSALDAFSAVVKLDPASNGLDRAFRQIESEYEDAENRASLVRDRIAAVEDVGEALFREWERELDLYESERLRQASERAFQQSRDRYEEMIAAMQRAESRIDPVLSRLRDQMLFLKHNLNAMAIASIENELEAVEREVADLIADMEAAINEANQFIETMGSGSGGTA